MALEPNFKTSSNTVVQDDIDQGLRSYMLSVYNKMALGVAFTGLIVLFMAGQPQLVYAFAASPIKWVLFAAVLGLGWFAPKVIMSKNIAAAHGLYWLYAAAWGLMISPFVVSVLSTDNGVMMVARAFFITSAMFAGASLFGYVTKKDLTGMGRFLMMATIGLVVAMLLNVFFFQDGIMQIFISGAIVLVFAAMTAYETQTIKNMYYEAPAEMLTRMSIFGAFMLYGSFVTMFIHVLSLIQMFTGGDE